ncbi:MAG: PEP-CTERM sorting domain-containing protein [Fimbriimonadaceae bacterium]
MNFRSTALIGFVALAAGASASIHLTNRENIYGVQVTDFNTFSDASFVGTVLQTGNADNATDSRPASFTLASGTVFDSWTGDSNISVDSLNTGVNPITATLNAHTTSTAVIQYHFHTAGIDNNFLTLGTSGGLNTLNIVTHAAGLLDDGGSATMQLIISGDWATIGTSSGDATYTMNTAGGWIFDSLTYDGSATTTFMAHQTGYLNDGAHNIDLNFTLYGSPAPEPASLCALGLGLVALVRKRRA